MASFAASINTGLKYSVLLHLLIVLNIFIYVYKQKDVPNAERIVSVELMNIKSGLVTNLKNTTVKVAGPPNKEAIPLQKSEAPPIKEAHKPAQAKPIVPMKDESVKKTVDIDKILSKLENLPNVEPAAGQKTSNSAMSDKPYDRSKPITIADYDKIRMQIEKKFFNPIVSEFAPGELIIRIKLDLKRSGEIERVTVLNSSFRPRHADAFSSLRDSLVRAVHMASPLQGMSEDSYEGENGWNEIELVFDAHRLMHIN